MSVLKKMPEKLGHCLTHSEAMAETQSGQHPVPRIQRKQVIARCSLPKDEAFAVKRTNPLVVRRSGFLPLLVTTGNRGKT